jgi:predicted transcriptional regulator
MEQRQELVELTAGIVSAYVAANQLPAQDVAPLIEAVFRALHGISSRSDPVFEEARAPAVPVKRSVTDDHIICLEDGKKFKSLKRHLRTKYNMSPEEYRHKWGLPHDYPMVAPSYAKARSQLAKNMGLGTAARVKKDSKQRNTPAWAGKLDGAEKRSRTQKLDGAE